MTVSMYIATWSSEQVLSLAISQLHKNVISFAAKLLIGRICQQLPSKLQACDITYEHSVAWKNISSICSYNYCRLPKTKIIAFL